MNPVLRKILSILAAIAVAYFYVGNSNDIADPASQALVSGSQTQGHGVVTRVLSDDNDGSRHQRFILRLPSGRTILVAHNIDLAPRVDGIETGDSIEYFGQFETNDRGGVIHWTHHDPQGRHVDGWLRHEGRTYQ